MMYGQGCREVGNISDGGASRAVTWHRHNVGLTHLDAHQQVCIDMRIDLCIDMCMDMCIDMGIDMCVDICIDMCTEMWKDMCIGMTYTCV